MTGPKSAFQILSMDGLNGAWSPKNIFAVSAAEVTRDDLLCWHPSWTAINFVVPFGSKVQISTRDHGMLTVKSGLMLLVYRKVQG